jgi:hypothetical protein
MTGPRYAIYFTPPPFSQLARFGAEILGYDGFHGSDVPHAMLAGVDPAVLVSLTASPRRYGFHATTVAPFHLKGHSESDVIEELLLFSETHGPVPLGPLEVSAFGRFVVLVPAEPQSGVSVLASDCLKAFDRFRAPLSAADRARRSHEGLTARQAVLLEQWGYPYVLDQFRFHMTLAGPVPGENMLRIRSCLAREYAALARNNVELDALSLVRQGDPNQRFRVVDRYRLRGEF